MNRVAADALGLAGWHPTHKVDPLAGRKAAAEATPRELLDIGGVVAAGEFNPDGSLVDFEAKMDMSEEMAQMTAQFCATGSMIFNTLTLSRQLGAKGKRRLGYPYRSPRAQDIRSCGSCKARGVRTSSLAERGLWGSRTAACQCE